MAALNPTEEDHLCSFAANGLVEREKSILGSWVGLSENPCSPPYLPLQRSPPATITKENSCFSSLGPITSYQLATLFSSSSPTNQLSCEGPAPGGVGRGGRGLVLWLRAILIGLKFQLPSLTPIIVGCSDPLKEGLEVKSQGRMGLEVC